MQRYEKFGKVTRRISFRRSKSCNLKFVCAVLQTSPDASEILAEELGKVAAVILLHLVETHSKHGIVVDVLRIKAVGEDAVNIVEASIFVGITIFGKVILGEV